MGIYSIAGSSKRYTKIGQTHFSILSTVLYILEILGRRDQPVSEGWEIPALPHPLNKSLTCRIGEYLILMYVGSVDTAFICISLCKEFVKVLE